MSRIIGLGDSSIKIKKFQMKNLKDHATIVMIAKRDSGKSWICRDILRQKSDIPCGMVIAPTDKMNGFYDSFVPPVAIHYSFDPLLIKILLRRQELMIEKAKEKAKDNKIINPSAFLVMDDCLADKKSWINDQTVREIFMNGRHYKITYLLTMQFSLGITPELRSNIDYIFLLAADTPDELQKIHKHYVSGIIPVFESFLHIFNRLTENYGCMIIDNKSKSKQLDDKIYWYKSKATNSDLVIGSKQFKDFSKKRYNPNWKKKQPIFDVTQLVSSKKKCNFSVVKVK